MIKCTNLDVKHAACLHIVLISQHPTSRPTTKSTQTAMVNAPKDDFWPLAARYYGKSTMPFTRRCHQANEGKSGRDTDKVGAFEALRSFRSKKQLVAKKGQDMHFISNAEKEKLIKDYVERETAQARKRVDDAEAAITQEQTDQRPAENAGLTTREPKKPFQEMMVAMGNGQSDRASSDDGEVGQDEADAQTKLGKRSEDDEPCWVLCALFSMVQQRMEKSRQKQMKLDKLTDPRQEDAADNLCERDLNYRASELMTAAVVERQTNDDSDAPVLTTFGE